MVTQLWGRPAAGCCGEPVGPCPMGCSGSGTAQVLALWSGRGSSWSEGESWALWAVPTPALFPFSHLEHSLRPGHPWPCIWLDIYPQPASLSWGNKLSSSSEWQCSNKGPVRWPEDQETDEHLQDEQNEAGVSWLLPSLPSLSILHLSPEELEGGQVHPVPVQFNVNAR